MPKMKSLRSFTLSTLTGHTIAFVAGEPSHVPPNAVSEAMKHGCVPVDASEVPHADDPSRPVVEFAGDIRQSMLYLVIDQIVKKNDPKEFTGAGQPREALVSERLGFDVSAKEVVKVFQLHQQGVKEETTYELHPHAVNIARVLEADKAELKELALEFGVEEPDFKGLDAKALRRKLLMLFGGVPGSA